MNIIEQMNWPEQHRRRRRHARITSEKERSDGRRCLVGWLMRLATNIWRQVESTLKQIDTVGVELECFQALQKQEQLAASHVINNLLEEVHKQKELEQITATYWLSWKGL